MNEGLAIEKRPHEFVEIAVSELRKGAASRMREDYGDIEALAESIKKYGLLEPIIINKHNVLIAGGRRVAAHLHLGYSTISAKRYTDLGDSEEDLMVAKEIELEENLLRHDLHWTEEVRGRRDVFRLRQLIIGARERQGRPSLNDGEAYTQRDAARDLGVAVGTINADVRLADGLDEFPDIGKETSKTAAIRRLAALRDQQIRTEKARRATKQAAADDAFLQLEGSDEPTTPRKATAAEEAASETRKKGLKAKFPQGILYFADSIEFLKSLPDECADVLITDPPYGLNLHKEGASTSGQRLADAAGTMYDDDHDSVMDMLDQVFMHLARVVRKDGHKYIFFHMSLYEKIFLMLNKHFGDCDPVPLIWSKNTTGIGNPNLRYAYSYEPCFFITHGKPLVTPQAFNVLKYDTILPKKKIHPTEKPTALLRHLVLASSVENEVIIDPFAGSGSTLLAAAQAGRRFLGIEKHEPFFRRTADRLATELGQ